MPLSETAAKVLARMGGEYYENLPGLDGPCVMLPDFGGGTYAEHAQRFERIATAGCAVGAVRSEADLLGEREELAGLRASTLRSGMLVSNLAMLVRRLCHALRLHVPGHDLPGKAVAFLKKYGLDGSALRSAGTDQEGGGA